MYISSSNLHKNYILHSKHNTMRVNYTAIAFFYLAMAVIVVFRDLAFYDVYNFFWFCDIGLILFAIAFYLRNVQLVKGLINVGLIAQFIFIVGIVAYSVFAIQIDNLPAHLFQTSWVNVIISVSIHLLSTNLALLLTYAKKNKPSSLVYSFAVLLLLYALTLAFTPASDNVNYVFSSGFLGFAIPYYTFLWPLLAFLILVLPTSWLQESLYRASRRLPRPFAFLK